jgi:glycolate oxidase iron-sulfur subunit
MTRPVAWTICVVISTLVADVVAGAEAIVMTASGCGVTVKDYGHSARRSALRRYKAKRISELTKDLSEIMPAFEAELTKQLTGKTAKRVAYHPPCTLQHGQQIRGKVESVLHACGVDVELCADSHLCCGSAGTYSDDATRVVLSTAR